MENVREIVLDTLLALEKEQDFSHRLMKAVLDKYDYLDSRDKAFVKRVTEGTIERRIELDYYLDSFSSVKVKKMKPLIRSLMRMSVYQILYMDGVPDSAACNEACKLAGKRKFQNLKGFVNGVLRNIAKNKENLKLPDEKKDPVAYLSVRYSMPDWIVSMWLKQYGGKVTEKMLQGLLQIHPVSLRFTKRGMEQGNLKEMLEQSGVNLRSCRYSDSVFLADKLENMEDLPGYEEGLFTVQDASSYLAVTGAGIQKDMVVLDMCAAPGGKSLLACEYANRVISGDVSEKKVEKILENAERLQVTNLQTGVRDASVYDESLKESADVLILDVPCSGLGVMGKKRDIKYNVSLESLEEILVLQKKIVEACWQYVKPGGILLYSTCTVRKEENQDMVAWILENLPFEPVDMDHVLPEVLKKEKEDLYRQWENCDMNESMKHCCTQLVPGFMETDGFFFAGLRRK